MRKAFLLLSLIVLVANNTNAQCRLPAHKGDKLQDQLAIIQRKLALMTRSHDAASYAKGASGTAKLLAQAQYDYTSGSPVFADSLRFTYSGTRVSSFDFDNLQYDFGNGADLPGFAGTNTPSSVQFDSAFDYTPAAPTQAFLAGRRQYNAASKVVLSDAIDPAFTDRTVFVYNAQGRVRKATVSSYDQGTGQWDSSSRNFYVYSSAGYLVRDSSETWDGSMWSPDLVAVYTNNTSGYPTNIAYGYSFGGVLVPFFNISLSFTGANLTKYILQVDQGMGLENYFKDTIGYAGSARTFINAYVWDAGTGTWVINSEERRHLNSSSLPDSVWTRVDYSGTGTFDTTIQKLTYNTDGNPTRRRYYMPGVAQAQYEERWYYNISTGIGGPAFTAARNVMLYPNPAAAAVYLKDAQLAKAGSWQYAVLDAKGALVVQGNTDAGKGIPVSSLPAGLYLLNITDGAGKMEKGTFIKQ